MTVRRPQREVIAYFAVLECGHHVPVREFGLLPARRALPTFRECVQCDEARRRGGYGKPLRAR
jgi:hypothetical protein